MWPPHDPIPNEPAIGSTPWHRGDPGERLRSRDARERRDTRPSGLRIGDAERDQVANALHEHFAQGRLTRDELDERLDTTLAAKTVGDLRPITADLPALKVDSARSNVASEDDSRSRRRDRWVRGAPAAAAFAALPMWMFLLVVFVLSSGRAFFLLLPILVFGWFIMAMRRFAFSEEAWHAQQPHWQHGHHHGGRHPYHHWSQHGHYMR